MTRFRPHVAHWFNERGAAPVLLLFALSAFSALGVAALTNDLGHGRSNETFTMLAALPQDNLTKFLTRIVVPESWRREGGTGSYTFDLPVLVPSDSTMDTNAPAAWHVVNDSHVPGMTVCCETRPGTCSQRHVPEGASQVIDWTPGIGDARWSSFQLESHPDTAGQQDLVSATVIATTSDGPEDGSTAVHCQFEFRNTVVAKGIAYLRQAPRQQYSDVPSDLVHGTFHVAVRTR